MTTATRTAPHHNTLTCYTDYKCRRPDCVTRYNDWYRARAHALAAGTWKPYVDAAPVREHLLELHAAGITPHRIEQITGIDWCSIRLFTQPHLGQGRGITKRTTPDTAAKILAVRLDDLVPGRVDATGTRRRVQALAAMGWPLAAVGSHIGIAAGYARHLAHREAVFGRTAQAVSNGYDELRHKRPQRNGITRTVAKRTRTYAARQNWAPPKYWDQHPGAIDDPDFEPMHGLLRAEIIAQDAHWLITTNGLDRDQAAERLNVSRFSVDRALREHPQDLEAAA
ncbi:hypothetical protein [Streptomyces lydicamycinicus]|uniref:hypothetical protein n=1 Tax=Streptomyces lydicamycinicus TaxID=1546107 RepID=UPI003C2EA8E1